MRGLDAALEASAFLGLRRAECDVRRIAPILDQSRMNTQIEIYVRPSVGRVLLNIYLGADVRDRFVDGIGRGEFECRDAPTHLELSVLPEWVTDPELRVKIAALDSPIHVRIPLTHINTGVLD